MTMLTAQQISTNIVNQVWLLDPSMSAEVGTPERKIVDGVSEFVAGTQVDFAVLNQKHDLDAMTGGRLDAYLGNFGFGRQVPRASAGGVTFSRSTPALQPIVIPLGTQLVGTVDSSDYPNLTFVTTETVTIPFGATSVTAPVRCTTVGTIGDLPSNSIQNFGGLKSIIGITSVTNTQPTQGGLDGEDDAAFKIRFKNQIFRNMSGTYDHIIALAVAAATVSKANVVGPLSRYQEYIQVPQVSNLGANEVQRITKSGTVTSFTVTIPDIPVTTAAITTFTAVAIKTAINTAIGLNANFVAGTTYVDVTGPDTTGPWDITYKDRFGRRDVAQLTTGSVVGGGSMTPSTVTEGTAPTGIDAVQKTASGSYDDNAGTVADPFAWPFKLTAVPSTIPYSKFAYPDNAFLTNGTLDPGSAEFYRPFVDWVFNPKAVSSSTPPAFAINTIYTVGQTVVGTNGSTYDFVVTQAGTSAGSAPTWPTALDATVTSGTVKFQNVGATGRQVDISPGIGARPNVTFLGDQAADGSPRFPYGLEPGEIALLEHQYMSKNSRNDFGLGIMNCIDVYVNGGEPKTVSSVQVMPGVSNQLQNGAAHVAKWIYQKQTAPKVINFRRALDGREARVGNRIMPLYWQPVIEVPDQITIGLDTYLRANYYNPADGTYYNAIQPNGSFLAIDKAHYAMVEEMNGLYGTVRARNGIEWFSTGHTGYSVGLRSVGGVMSATGNYYVAHEGEQFDVVGYAYDQNIGVSQALQESKSQVTDDILVHRALKRYFKVYITVMYSPGATQNIVNAGISAALSVFFENQFYGAAIQLSDILQAIHNVPGVDNVRWTADITPMPDASELKEWTLTTAYTAGQYISPDAATENGYMYFVTGSGTSGGTAPTWNTTVGSTVSDGTATYKNVGLRVKVEECNALGGALESGARYFMNDFFIEDRELASAPSANIAVIVKRAQNTWST